jgi:high-affinity nickel-transport protein
VGLLHLAGWGLYLHFAAHHPALVGLGFAAYLLGLRHGFDADHIAAIDDSVRYLLQKRKGTLSVGLLFSLGHSTLVLALALAVGLAATLVKRHLPQLQSAGGLIGVGVSGLFLIVIGLLNFFVLLDIPGIWRHSQEHSHAHLDALLAKRGLLNQLFRGRMQNILTHSWQMYPPRRPVWFRFRYCL